MKGVAEGIGSNIAVHPLCMEFGIGSCITLDVHKIYTYIIYIYKSLQIDVKWKNPKKTLAWNFQDALSFSRCWLITTRMTVHLFRLGDTNLHFQLGGGISQQTINLKITPCQEKPYARLPKFGFNMLAFEDWNHLKEKTMTNTHRKKK